MLVDCILDLSAKWNLINFEYSSFNDTYLVERCIIFLGYIYPSLGYFIALVVSPSQIGVLYWGLTNSQTIWIAGAFLAIIHTSKRNIWTVEWVLFLLLGLTGNTLAVPYTDNIAVSIFYYVCIVAQVVVFLFLYSKTILLAMRKARTRLSQSDYFCLMYSTLIFFMFFVQIVIPGVISELYNEEVTLIYTNIALVVCITLASIIPNRAKQIKLQSTEQSLAMRQAFVRYLSHEMRTPINVALVGLTIHEQYLEENSLRSSECREVLLDVRTAIGESLDTLNEV
jgi:signal transduction histidine kinase